MRADANSLVTIRAGAKYAHMLAFGTALPKIRRRLAHDLALPGLPREKVLATVVRLLEVSLIRIGNEEYVRENESFGLTTKWHEVDIQDRRLARIVRTCQDLPGQELFQFVDPDGVRRDVNSEDVNEYLRNITRQDFTAKDFRTWAGTVLAAMALREFKRFDSQTEAKKNVLRAIESVAERLGNTVTVCRKCYVHPEVLNAYMDGTLVKLLKSRAERQLAQSLKALKPEEAAVLAFLQHRLAHEDKRLKRQLRNSLRTV